MDNSHDVSYDATISALMEKIRGIVEQYQNQFDAEVTQQPLGLFHMAEVLAHLPDARLRGFPEHVLQWKKSLDQHMTVLAELTTLHRAGVETLQQMDSEAGRRLRARLEEN